ADVYHVWPDAASEHGIVQILAAYIQFSLLTHQFHSSIIWPGRGLGLRGYARKAFIPAEQTQYIENSRRGRLPGKRRPHRLRELAKTQPQALGHRFETGFERTGCPVGF